MSETTNVTLACCRAKVTVPFQHSEAPALPSNQFRKNVSCPSCQKTVIVTMTRMPGGAAEFEQEVLDS
jgi:hypothetical protein